MAEIRNVTIESLKGARTTQTAHLNHGRDGSGYSYRCVEYPRLSITDRHFRDRRPSVRTYFVDGEPCNDIHDAIDKLNVPVVLTDEDKANIEKVPVDWADLRAWQKQQGLTPVDSMILLHALADKGLIEHGRDPEDDRKPTIRRRPVSPP